MNDQPVLQLRDVSKLYKKQLVLDHLSLDVRPGSVLGLLGKNGAGKTTLIKIALGLVRPQSGEATLLGEPAWDLSAAAKERLGYVPQTPQFFPWMKVGHMIEYTASFYERWNDELVARLVRRWEIPLDKRIGPMSPGEQQKLAIVLGIAHEPELLVLDEPAAALDPDARRSFLLEILEMASHAWNTIVFSTHITSDLERVADRVALLQKGVITYEGELESLKDQVKRLRVSSRRPLPPRFDFPGVIRQQVEGFEALLSVRDCSPELVSSIESKCDAAVEIEDLNLEDIFLELHHA